MFGALKCPKKAENQFLTPLGCIGDVSQLPRNLYPHPPPSNPPSLQRWNPHHHQQLMQALSFDDDLDDTLNCTTSTQPTQHTSTAESPLHDDAVPAHQRELVDTAPPFHPAHRNQHLLQSTLTFPRANTPSPKHSSHCTPTPTRATPTSLTRTARLILEASSTSTTPSPSTPTPGQICTREGHPTRQPPPLFHHNPQSHPRSAS